MPRKPSSQPPLLTSSISAGPRTEGDYTAWMLGEFAKRGLKLELQAPQGPTYILSPFICTGSVILVRSIYHLLFPSSQAHIRMCSICPLLFPSMSYRHSAQLQIMNSTEASLAKIWRTVESVRNETSSSAEVARAFVLAFRVMRLIAHCRRREQLLARERYPTL
jgi:hypothetical protein